ncbi:MAG TPA: outer membrane beta-barrel protein [Verrucomicrobiae bacterium]|nr:outer membrane beta-barrel protein [Verrucomicrobiae bacterium]
MKVQKVVIVIVLLSIASLAKAQYYWYGPEGMGPYFRAGIGPTIFQDSMVKSFYSPADPSVPYNGVNGPSGRVNYDVGFAFDGAFGWAFNKYVGLDFDTGYIWGRMNSVQNYQANGSTMANVPLLADLTISLPIPHTNIVPYIGGGAGGAVSILDAHNFTYPPTGDYADGSESDLVFAYRAFAGVRFMLGPNVSLGVGYQYFATGNPTFTYTGYLLPDLNTEFQGVRTHSIMFTLHANF